MVLMKDKRGCDDQKGYDTINQISYSIQHRAYAEKMIVGSISLLTRLCDANLFYFL